MPIGDPVGLVEQLEPGFNPPHRLQGGHRQLPNLSVLNLTDRPDGGGQQGTGLAGVLQAIGETNALRAAGHVPCNDGQPPWFRRRPRQRLRDLPLNWKWSVGALQFRKVNFQPGDASAEAAERTAQDVVEQVLELQPLLQRTLRVPLPDQVSTRLGTVTPHQLEALGRLPPEGITMREFATAVGISGAAATALASRMIRQGLAKRRYDDNDRRTVWLVPTAEGQETAGAVRDWRRQSVTRMFERLDAAQVTAFLEVLSALTGPAPGTDSSS